MELRATFSGVWNESLEKREERPLKERNNIWATELGNAPIDVYLKMKGIKPSNPPEPRALRKFEAGNIWEWIIGLVLKRAGILRDAQKWVKFQYPGLLEVTGKLDFTYGGQIDWDEARARVFMNVDKAPAEIVERIKQDVVTETLQEYPDANPQAIRFAVDRAIDGYHNFIKNNLLLTPDFLTRAMESVFNYFSVKYADGIKEVILENKSCSAFMFERYLATNQAADNHRKQLFHYLIAEGKDEGHILYVSKDDARLLEIGVMNPSAVEDEYRSSIEIITKSFNSGERPPLEPEVTYDYEWGRFSDNWKVKYSNYLTMLYGFENQSSFENKWKKEISSWNRVMGRIIRGDNMTKLNLEIIERIKQTFPNFDEIADFAKANKKVVEEDADTEE